MKSFKTIFALLLLQTSLLFSSSTYIATVQASIGPRSLPTIRGAEVTAINTSTLERTSDTTDIFGKASLSPLSTNSYTITVFKTGYAMAFQDITINKSTQHTFTISTQNRQPSGTVSNSQTGDTIENATVYLNRNNIQVSSTTTDSDGKYSFPISDFGTDTFTISVEATDYQAKSVGVDQSTRKDDMKIALSPNEAILQGQVKADGTMNPIEGALVSVQANGKTINSDITDSSGNYTIGGLSTASYDFVVNADGYNSLLTGVQTTIGPPITYDVTLTLGGGSISGTVIDDDTGNPQGGIIINLWLDGVNIQTATTGSDGTYHFSNLGSALYIVIAGGNEHEAGYGKAEVVTTDPVTINFSLGNNPGSVSGIVRSSGAPLAGATVNIKQANIAIKTTITDASGTYSFTGLAPGTYLVYAIESGYQTSVKTVVIQSPFPTQQNFDLLPGGGSITGSVKDGGSGIPSAHVKVTLNGVVIDEEITDSSGNYLAEGLPTNLYDVIAGATGYQFKTDSASVISGGSPTVVNFSLITGGSSVSGTITDAQTGDPIDEAVVEILDQGSNFFEYTVSKGNGDYIINGIYNGTFVVQASALGYVTEQTDSFSLSGNTTKNLALYTNNPPTNNLQGIAYSNRSLLAEDRIHKLTWGATTSPEVTGYRVYKNGELVASIGLNDTLEYESHNNPVDEASIYTVISVNSDGSQSNGASVQLQ